MHSRKIRNLIVRTLGTESKAILTCFANSTGYEKRLCTMTPVLVSSIKMGDLNAVGVLESTKTLYT